jgi:hypothetical protein
VVVSYECVDATAHWYPWVLLWTISKGICMGSWHLSTCPFPNIISTFVDIVLHLIGSPLAILHSLEGVVGPGFMGEPLINWHGCHQSACHLEPMITFHMAHKEFLKKRRKQPLGHPFKNFNKSTYLWFTNPIVSTMTMWKWCLLICHEVMRMGFNFNLGVIAVI